MRARYRVMSKLQMLEIFHRQKTGPTIVALSTSLTFLAAWQIQIGLHWYFAFLNETVIKVRRKIWERFQRAYGNNFNFQSSCRNEHLFRSTPIAFIICWWDYYIIFWADWIKFKFECEFWWNLFMQQFWNLLELTRHWYMPDCIDIFWWCSSVGKHYTMHTRYTYSCQWFSEAVQNSISDPRAMQWSYYGTKFWACVEREGRRRKQSWPPAHQKNVSICLLSQPVWFYFIGKHL